MKKALLLLAYYFITNSAFTQQQLKNKLTYSAKLTFASYSLPFKKMEDNFKNLSGAIGIDYAYNTSQTLLQSFTAGILHHKQLGNSTYINTQLTYRPLIFKVLEPSISLGIGHLLSFSNAQNQFYVNHNGSWEKSAKQSKSHWQLPISVSLGYKLKAFKQATITPVLGYEAVGIINYNSGYPIMPYSVITIGSRFKL